MLHITVKRLKKGSILGWGGLILGLYIVYSLSFSLWKLFLVRNRVKDAETEFSLQRTKLSELLVDIKEASSSAFVEKVARDELLMQKKGEVVAILPEDLSSGGDDIKTKSVKTDNLKNWEKWWRLVAGPGN